MIIHQEDFEQLQGVCDRLFKDANAKLVFIVDKNGQLIAASGNSGDMDTTSMASLAAGNIAATGGLAQLIGEKEFSSLNHEGENDNLHLSIIASKLILVVVFDNHSSLGLVRLRVRKAAQALEDIIKDMDARHAADQTNPLFAEITDDDIENLFND